MKELNKKEMVNTSGGAPFTYRLGQLLAIVKDYYDGPHLGVFNTVGGLTAMNDWFG